MFDRVVLFGRHLTRVPPGDLEKVVEALSSSKVQNALFCNVHMLMLSLEDPRLAGAMDQANFVFTDGVPVAWLQSRFSASGNRVVRGHEVMTALCQRAAAERQKIGLFGSTAGVLDALARNLRKMCPDLKLALMISPPQVVGELQSNAAEIQAINDLNLKWLFVSLGCPKQEKWIHNYAAQLNCSLLGVGAAFDWLAGTTPKPPEWMEKSGLGWLFRLLQDPKRMWRRYLIYNTKFMLKSAVLLIRKRLRRGGDSPEPE